jgi:hypothetical protein
MWLYRYVPLVDYPNHLARMEILSLYDQSPRFQSTYVRDRRPLPNLGMDLVVPYLREYLPLDISGKLFLTGLLALYCAGTAMLGAVLHGRIAMRALLLWPTFYNSTLLWGLINYVSGVCLFVLWAALLIYIVDKPRRPHPLHYALLLVGAVLCYLAHLTAFIMCCVAWGALVVRSLVLERRVGKPLLICGATLLVPIAIYVEILLSAPRHLALAPTPGILVWAWPGKIAHFSAFTRGYDWHEDLIPTLLLIGAFGYCLYRVRTGGWVSVALWPALAFFFLFFVLPLNGNADTWAFDARFYWPAWLFLILALPASGWSAREKTTLAVVTFLAWGMRLETLTAHWKTLSRDSAEMIAVLYQVPEGARLYPVCGTSNDWDVATHIRALCHVTEYAVVDRGIIDPALFSMRGGQPITFRSQPPVYKPQGAVGQLPDYDYVWTIEPSPVVRAYLNAHANPIAAASGFVLWRLRRASVARG